MTFRSTLAVAVLGFGLTLSGCDVVDDINNPQAITPGQALDNIEGYGALLVQAYDALQAQSHYGQQFMLVPDALADNIRIPNTSSNRYPAFTENRTGAHLGRWGGHYGAINAMNIIIAGIDDLEDETATQAERDQIKGEAYFMRALNYFDLIRTKAYEPGREVDGWTEGVIIRTEPTENLESADFRERASNTEVYNLILADLQEAASLLDENERQTNTPSAFVSEAAVKALQARVNLYLRNWEAAEAAAEAALAETSAALVTADSDGAALVSAWSAVSHPESIFEVTFTAGTDGAVTNSNASLQSLTDPSRAGFYDAVPTDDLIAAHEAGDARLALYEDFTVGTEALQYITKYTGTSAQDVDRAPVFRVSEMFLILAEARAEQNDASGALDALNTLRNARGLGDYSGSDIVDQVYRERRVELAFEGHRFFDLKRRGLDIPKPQQPFNVLPYTDFRILAPLPQSEVDESPVLVQNPGYAS
jgi:hypothetical protein